LICFQLNITFLIHILNTNC